MSKPNVLLLFTDQQRFDTVHALGNPIIKTPNLDRLCSEGVAFTSAYTSCPVCVPARCSLHYGQYPMTSGCYENWFPMPDDRPSFMEVLSKNGYRTHGIGKCHFTPDGDALRGFQTRETQEENQRAGGDDFMRFIADHGYGHAQEPNGVRGEMYYIPQVSMMPEKYHPTNWIGERSVAFIQDQKESDQPWMLFSSFIHPHPPFAPPTPWHKLYRAAMMPLPKTPTDSESLHTHINRHQNRYKYRDQGIDQNLLRCMKAHYYACISFIDYQIGKILTALEESGQLDNTLIVFTSDHGEHLGDYNCFGKRSMHDSCARVPMLLRMPGRFAGGWRCDDPASLVDVAPTILHAALGETGGLQSDGIDLHAALSGETSRDAVHIQHDRENRALYTTITKRHKYCYSAADDQEFLFDRMEDPDETRNRAGLTFTQDSVRGLRKTTIDWLCSGNETCGISDGTWKRFPKETMPTDPDTNLLIQDPPGFVPVQYGN